MSYIPVDLRKLVIARAKSRCEYCGLSQASQEATFHIDHILPESLGGETDEKNLALACVSCSLRKAARVQIEDPQSGAKVFLFNPRQDAWQNHFIWQGDYVSGLTSRGRATIEALQMNRTLALAIRHEQALLGRHPPR